MRWEGRFFGRLRKLVAPSIHSKQDWPRRARQNVVVWGWLASNRRVRQMGGLCEIAATMASRGVRGYAPPGACRMNASQLPGFLAAPRPAATKHPARSTHLATRRLPCAARVAGWQVWASSRRVVECGAIRRSPPGSPPPPSAQGRLFRDAIRPGGQASCSWSAQL